jgi:hypothetical protein
LQVTNPGNVPGIASHAVSELHRLPLGTEAANSTNAEVASVGAEYWHAPAQAIE